MYCLSFVQKKSKHAETALSMACEFRHKIRGNRVFVYLKDSELRIAYSSLRTLLGYVQHWKGTRARYHGRAVDPYPFLLFQEQLQQCAALRKEDPCNCLSEKKIAWSCRKIQSVHWHTRGTAPYKNNRRYWYNFGFFRGKKWYIDKEALTATLCQHIQEKGIDRCPFFEYENLRKAIAALPNYLYPDGNRFYTYYKEVPQDTCILKIPENIRHRF